MSDIAQIAIVLLGTLTVIGILALLTPHVVPEHLVDRYLTNWFTGFTTITVALGVMAGVVAAIIIIKKYIEQYQKKGTDNVKQG